MSFWRDAVPEDAVDVEAPLEVPVQERPVAPPNVRVVEGSVAPDVLGAVLLGLRAFALIMVRLGLGMAFFLSFGVLLSPEALMRAVENLHAAAMQFFWGLFVLSGCYVVGLLVTFTWRLTKL